MKRTEQREHIFKLIFGADFNEESEQGNADSPGGGYSIAPEKFVNELQEILQKEAVLYGRVDKIAVSGAGALGLPYEAT